MSIIVVEDDAILRIVPVLLDPSAPDAHRDAVADFFAHDVPDFPGWCRGLQARIPGLYPANVVFAADQDDLDAKIADADGVIVEGLQINRKTLTAANKLAVVQRFGTVVGNIDVAACAERGIAVEILRRRVNIAVAEQAMTFMLALGKRLCALNGLVEDATLRQAGFDTRPYDRRYTGNSNFARVAGLKTLYGATLGIIGMGEIGRELAQRAAAFEMRILYHQRNPIGAIEEHRYGARYAALGELLEQSDYVAIQLPMNESTRGFLGREQLGRIKPGAILVNAARAELIDRDALVAALASKRLGGFALDVGYSEPAKPDDPLLKFKDGNAILVPHTAIANRENGLMDMEEMCLKLWRAIMQRRR